VRHVDAQRLSGLQIDHKLELGRLLDGKVGRFRALQQLDEQPRDYLPINLSETRAISEEAAFFRSFGPLVNGRKAKRRRAFDNDPALLV
jgi:hypothetical protein